MATELRSLFRTAYTGCNTGALISCAAVHNRCDFYNSGGDEREKQKGIRMNSWPSAAINNLCSLVQHELRVGILLCLGNEHSDVTSLAKELNVDLHTISHHLRHLRHAGLVHARPHKTHRVYSIRNDVVELDWNDDGASLRIRNDQASICITFGAHRDDYFVGNGEVASDSIISRPSGLTA